MSSLPHGRQASTGPFAFATRTLARAAATLFVLIALVTMSCAGYTYFKVRRERAVATEKREFDRIGAETLARILDLEKKVRSEVAEVRQSLSEIAAARDQKSRDEIVLAMESSAKRFAGDVADAAEVADLYGGAGLAATFAGVAKSFPSYFEHDIKLARAYAAAGPAAVERPDAAVDPAAGEIQERLGRIGPAIDAARQARMARTAAANAEIDALREDTMKIALATCLITALAGMAGVLAVRAWVVRPLRALTQCFAELAAGDTRRESVVTHRADEIGDLGRAYDDFRRIVLDSRATHAKSDAQDALIASERGRAEAEKAGAERRKIEAMRAMVDQVEAETNLAVASLIELMDNVTGVASEMSDAADRLGMTTSAVSSASDEALGSMRSASSSTKELSTSINRVADQIRDARSTSDEAVVASRRASQSIEALSRVAAEIDEVTGLIANITRQTGLLALNAGVEAARAGVDGHGFAIIAREIRSLADQTAEATSRIGGLIRQVQGSTVGSVAAVDSIAKAIDAVSDSSARVTTAIKTQVATTKTIADSVNGTTQSVTNMTSQIQIVADGVKDTQSMSRKVEDVCLEASQKVRELQINLVKIVRTSSDAVNRRVNTRYETDIAATVEYGWTVTPVRVADISEGGARLLGEIDPSASAFALVLPGLETPIQARVATRREGSVHASFELSGEASDRLRAWLERLAAGGATARLDEAA
jgi:methyl-accepting chemotaxis protein